MPRTTFNKVIIIQSLKEYEFQTGVKLHEDLEILSIAHANNLPIDLKIVSSRNELIETFKSILLDVHRLNCKPIVHIECHGDPSCGLQLSNNDHVSWNELKNVLTPINIALRLNLIVVVSACFGAHLSKVLFPTDRAFCYTILGPKDEISSGELLNAFITYYKDIFITGDAFSALKKINNITNIKNNFYFNSASSFFAESYSFYKKELCTDNELLNRSKKIRKHVKSQGIHPVPSLGSIKRMLRNTNEALFDKYKTRFFMIDMYPDNIERFPLCYGDI